MSNDLRLLRRGQNYFYFFGHRAVHHLCHWVGMKPHHSNRYTEMAFYRLDQGITNWLKDEEIQYVWKDGSNGRKIGILFYQFDDALKFKMMFGGHYEKTEGQ